MLNFLRSTLIFIAAFFSTTASAVDANVYGGDKDRINAAAFNVAAKVTTATVSATVVPGAPLLAEVCGKTYQLPLEAYLYSQIFSQQQIDIGAFPIYPAGAMSLYTFVIAVNVSAPSVQTVNELLRLPGDVPPQMVTEDNWRKHMTFQGVRVRRTGGSFAVLVGIGCNGWFQETEIGSDLFFQGNTPREIADAIAGSSVKGWICKYEHRNGASDSPTAEFFYLCSNPAAEFYGSTFPAPVVNDVAPPPVESSNTCPVFVGENSTDGPWNTEEYQVEKAFIVADRRDDGRWKLKQGFGNGLNEGVTLEKTRNVSTSIAGTGQELFDFINQDSEHGTGWEIHIVSETLLEITCQ